MKIDKNEMHKNDNILYDEYNDYKIQKNIALTKVNSNNLITERKVLTPLIISTSNIISKYGKIVNIGKNKEHFRYPTISEILDYNTNPNIDTNKPEHQEQQFELDTSDLNNTLFEVIDNDLMDLHSFDLSTYDISTYDISTYENIIDLNSFYSDSFYLEADY